MKAFGELVKHVRSFFFIITILIFSYYLYIFIFTFLLSSNGRKCSLKTLQRRLMQRYENVLMKGVLKNYNTFFWRMTWRSFAFAQKSTRLWSGLVRECPTHAARILSSHIQIPSSWLWFWCKLPLLRVIKCSKIVLLSNVQCT